MNRNINQRTTKTKLCVPYTVGKCPKTSSSCCDAHGMAELRPTNWDAPGVRKNSKGYWENPYTKSRR